MSEEYTEAEATESWKSINMVLAEYHKRTGNELTPLPEPVNKYDIGGGDLEWELLGTWWSRNVRDVVIKTYSEAGDSSTIYAQLKREPLALEALIETFEGTPYVFRSGGQDENPYAEAS